MSDMWLNVGYEDDRLLPFTQPEQIVENPLIGKLNTLHLICLLFIHV